MDNSVGPLVDTPLALCLLDEMIKCSSEASVVRLYSDVNQVHDGADANIVCVTVERESMRS